MNSSIASSNPELSLVFPVFDEAENIDELVETALHIGSRLRPHFEIILVDDGSRDGSDARIGTWVTSHPRVRSVRHPSNIGYGAALRSGLREAKGELVFFSDADLQFDLNEIEKLLAHMDDFDIVVGYRSPRRDPWPRRVLAWGWGKLVAQVFDLEVRDIDCAFKVFRRDVLESLPIASVGAFVNTEILARALAGGWRIHQVPVSHRRRARGSQTGAHPRVILRAFAELSALYGELRQSKKGDNSGKARS